MASPVAVSNLQRFVLPEVEISYDSNGIISIIDDLVERVMNAHYRRAQLRNFADEELANEHRLVA